MRNRVFALICFVFLVIATISSFAQLSPSITIISPSSGATVSGTTLIYKVALANAPTITRVCFVYDSAFPVGNSGASLYIAADAAQLDVGCSITAPFSYQDNSAWYGNGTHTITATGYDDLGNIVATSSPSSFIVANAQPAPYTSTLTVSTSTPVTSNWSGVVNVIPTITGSGSDTISFSLAVDGIFQLGASTSAGTATLPLGTTNFLDGPRTITIVAVDTSMNPYPDDPGFTDTVVGEWIQKVNYANGAVSVEVHNTSRDNFHSIGDVFSLGCTTVNANTTTVALPCDYLPMNSVTGASIFTVNPTTGQVTVTANGSAQVQTTAEACSASDLVINIITQISSTNCKFTSASVGTNVVIKGGGTFNPGIYTIKSFFTAGCINGVATPCVSLKTSPTGGLASSSGQFSTGPTTTSNVLVWPSNTMPHLGKNNTILNAYDPANSLFVFDMFTSADNVANGQNYISACNPSTPIGFVADINCSYMNAIEFGVPYTTLDKLSSGSQATFQTTQDNSILQFVNGLTGYGKFLWCDADGLARQPAYVWAGTREPASPFAAGGTPWSTPAITYAFTSLNRLSPFLFLGCAMSDEFNITSHPFQGPLQVSGAGSNQNWFRSIVANGTGGCVVNSWNTGINPQLNPDLGSFGLFTVSGSSAANLNSVGGVSYTVTSSTATTAAFSCPNVSSGTYDATTDPGLIINPLTWGYENAGDVIQYDGLASIMEQVNASTNPPAAIDWPPGAGTNYIQLGNIMGNGTQSIRAITQMSTVGEVYQSPSAGFMISRQPSNSALTNPLAIGPILRSYYGAGYSPSLPLVSIMEGTPHNRGYQGNTVPMVSFIGDTITTLFPHGITTILPGITRVGMAGTSNLSDSNQSYPITGATCAANVVTATIGTNGINVGNGVTISGVVPGGYNTGSKSTTPPTVAASATSSTTVSYPVASCPGSYVSGGIVSLPGFGDYFVLSAPTPYTLIVARASTSAICFAPSHTPSSTCATSTSGTITFQDGTQTSIIEMSAGGGIAGIFSGSTFFQYSGSPNDSFSRNRGKRFNFKGTAVGPQAAYFNGNDFVFDAENLNAAINTNGAALSDQNYYREIPKGNSTGGTLTVIPDNTFVPGRSGFKRLNNYATPGMAFGLMVEGAINGVVVDRLYKTETSEDAYQDHILKIGSGASQFQTNAGYIGINQTGLWSIFPDTSGYNGSANQLFSNPHFQSGRSVAMFHANNSSAGFKTAFADLLMTPRIDAPDIGKGISCGARVSSLLFCWNATDGVQTRTYPLPSFSATQATAQYVGDWKGKVKITIIPAGTTTSQVSLLPDESIWFALASRMIRPVISVPTIPNSSYPTATKVVLTYAFDPYWLDVNPENTIDCGTGTCTPLLDKHFGTIYVKLTYLDASMKRVGRSGMLVF